MKIAYGITLAVQAVLVALVIALFNSPALVDACGFLAPLSLNSCKDIMAGFVLVVMAALLVVQLKGFYKRPETTQFVCVTTFIFCIFYAYFATTGDVSSAAFTLAMPFMTIAAVLQITKDAFVFTAPAEKIEFETIKGSKRATSYQVEKQHKLAA